MATYSPDDSIPVTCPTCEQLMWFKEFYTHHVHRVHGLNINHCPFCYGEAPYSPKHASDCRQRFLEENQFVNRDSERVWKQRVMKYRKKYLQSELAYYALKKQTLELNEAYEQVEKDYAELRNSLYKQ